MIHELRLYDRSRVTTDWSCERKRYWQYEFQGKGVVSTHTSLELYTGTCIHDGLAAIAHQHLEGRVDIDLIASTAFQQMFEALMLEAGGQIEGETFAKEQATLVEGLLRGAFKHIWPRLMAQYPKIRLIEAEMTYEHDGLVFMARPDLVLEDNAGNIVYCEWKSTSSKKESWITSWDTAVQLHSTIRAIETTLKEKVTGVQIVGLYKGFESYGKQSSPFCYAYLRKGTPPFSKDQVEYAYKAGFQRSPTWEMEGGVKKWVEEMPEQILADQFPCTPLIFVRDHLVDNFFKQRAVREKEIELALGMMAMVDEEAQEALLNTAFEQKFDQCQPAWGHPCSYRKICHGRVEDPLREGFQWREPHHQPEVDQWKETDGSL